MDGSKQTPQVEPIRISGPEAATADFHNIEGDRHPETALEVEDGSNEEAGYGYGV